LYNTGGAYGAGYMQHLPFFELMRAVERAGIDFEAATFANNILKI